MYRERFGRLNRDQSYTYPQFADSSPVLSDLLQSEKVDRLVSAFLGPNYLYKGSDGASYGGGSPWHRDY